MIESNLLDAQTTQSANEAANLHAEAEILVAMGALDAAFERAKASLKNAAAEELGDDHEFPCQALMVLARVAYARGNQPEYIRLRAEVERRMALIAPTQTQAVSDLAFAYSQLPPKAN